MSNSSLERISLLTLLFFIGIALPVDIYAQEESSDSAETVQEMAERLNDMDSDELEARKDEIEEELEEEDDDRKIVALLRELTLIEQILGAAAGLILLDNICDDDSKDTVAPVITLNGSNPDSVELGDTYVDPGADADTGETVVVSGSVDTSTVGSYTLTYTATDASGN